MTAPAVDDGRVVLANGTVGTGATYNSTFTSGQPYTVAFVSSTQMKITDALGNDVTADASKNGVISNTSGSNQSFSFRGVDMKLNLNLKAGDTNPDAVIAGHSFQLAVTPDTFTTSRSRQLSTALITGSSITDQAATRGIPAGWGDPQVHQRHCV